METFDLPIYIYVIVIVSIPFGLYGLYIYSQLLTNIDQLDKHFLFKRTSLICLILTLFFEVLIVSSYMLLFEIDQLINVSIYVFIFGIVLPLVLTLGPILLLRLLYRFVDSSQQSSS